VTDIAYYLFLFLVALIVGQGLLVLRFVFTLGNWRRPLIANEGAPKAAVILCLRGGDPFLVDCIRGLLGQDYPNYEVHVVIDHEDDPANAILSELLAAERPDNVFVQFLKAPRETCSLKCSSVVQVVHSLNESHSFIAQLDADTIPHATWLRELATALTDERVGAATGNRWYMPEKLTVASMVRYIWNAAAVIQMCSYGIAWGGTLAVKMSVLRDTDLLDKWSNAFCEDTMLFAFLRKHRLRVAFVPSLMMINRESCDLGGFYRWVGRQLLTARLYHPAWLAVVAHGFITFLAPLFGVVALIWSLAVGNASAAIWFGAGFAFYQVSATLMLAPVELAVRRIANSRGEPTRWLGLRGVLLYLIAMPLTQFVYTAALAAACRMRSTDWRGVTYDVGGPWAIRLREYQPYAAQQDEHEAASL
jgi:cellulose synthase/poly-beta-1,6-N-acetylglucosamine synthase-like glycosyltransferase